jgi:hypothetical protein
MIYPLPVPGLSPGKRSSIPTEAQNLGFSQSRCSKAYGAGICFPAAFKNLSPYSACVEAWVGYEESMAYTHSIACNSMIPRSGFEFSQRLYMAAVSSDFKATASG